MSNTNVATVPERWRVRISEANILNRLLKHFNNQLDVPLKPDQVALGIKLIGKILPDLQSVSIEASIQHSDLSRLELDAKLIALGYNPEDTWKTLEKPVINHRPMLIEQDDDHEPIDTHDSINDTSEN